MTGDLFLEPTVLDDASLLALVRARGESAEDAFDELYRRHHEAALRIARRVAGAQLAPEIVSEAFTRVLDLLNRGAGPNRTLRAYLAATINSVWVDHVRVDTRHVWVDDDSQLESLVSVEDGAAARAEASVVGAAFATLPERWQTVLWLSSVDEVPYEEIGRLLDLGPNAVAALVQRAREGLRQAYLSEHLGVVEDPECLEVAPLLAAWVRGRASRRNAAVVEQHLETCAPCREAVRDLRGMSLRLGALLLPAVALVAAHHARTYGLVLLDPAVGEATAAGVGAHGQGVGSPASGAGVSGSVGGIAAGVAVGAALVALAAAAVVGSRVSGDRPVDLQIAENSSSQVQPAPTVPPAAPPPSAPLSSAPLTSEPAVASPRAVPAPSAAPRIPDPWPTTAVVVPPPGSAGPDAGEPPVDPPVAPSPDPRLEGAGVTIVPDALVPGWVTVTVPVLDVPAGSLVDLDVQGAVLVCVVPDGCTLPLGGPWSGEAEVRDGAVVVQVQRLGPASLRVALRDGGGRSLEDDVLELDLT